jgi:hypothetical protein
MDAATHSVDTTELERRLAQLEAAARGGAAASVAAQEATGSDEHGEEHEQPWAEALARVHGASDFLKFTLQRIAELEAWNREMTEVTAHRLELLEREAIAAEVRAEEDEEACREAEDWLRRIHAAVIDRLGPASG